MSRINTKPLLTNVGDDLYLVSSGGVVKLRFVIDSL